MIEKKDLNQIALIGLGTMGASLARNIAGKGFKTAVYNRTHSKTLQFVNNFPDLPFESFSDLQSLIQSLEIPRKVILMVPSGQAVENMVSDLIPLLQPGDIIIDCGNSNWKDTLILQDRLQNHDLQFIGCGVSGGEEGALKGPSIMPGGTFEAVEKVLPIFELIAAKDFNGNACVTNVGLAAAGHFVKMVHNGIEYALMQGIAEIYDLLKNEGVSNEEILNFFQRANDLKTSSYLIEITIDILQTKESHGDLLLNQIKDEAKAKGTGRWTTEAALELGVNAPTLAAAVFARISSARNQIFSIDKLDHNTEKTLYSNKNLSIENLLKALESIYLVSYLQGLDLIDHANREFNWAIDLQEVVRIWQGGCIIRSEMLRDLYKKWQGSIDLTDVNWHLWFTANLSSFVSTPVISSSSDYVKALLAEHLPANLIQAQRDYFGAHTYRRIDQEGDFTGGWVRSTRS